jgi:hypothetical protein
MNYTEIFNKYRTKEGKLFYLLNRSVSFPEDKTLAIYDTKVITENTPWTILSYNIYDKIDFWWILCSINKSSLFYAKDGDIIYYIKPEYISLILNSLK